MNLKWTYARDTLPASYGFGSILRFSDTLLCESVHCFGLVDLAGMKNCRWKFWLIGRIRKMLGFEAQSLTRPELVAVLSVSVAVQCIARVKLKARLAGQYLQQTAAVAMIDRRLQF